MKQFLALLLTIIALTSFAQTPDMKQYEKQLKMVQQKVDALKKAYPGIDSATKAYNKNKSANQKYIDSISAANGVKSLEMPDINKFSNATVPDFSKMQDDQEQRMKQLQSMKTNMQKTNQQGLPQKSNIAFTAQSCSNKEIDAWNNTLLVEATQKLDLLSKAMLNEMYNDTSKNAASVGMLLMANGMPINMGQYMVCRYLQDHPNNAMAINDLGIFLRLKKDYQKAIPAFLYALKLTKDSSNEIKTNLAWAYAYAGNFSQSKQYFNNVLTQWPNYGMALEGLSLIAYQEGDKQALWNNLAKQMMQHYRTGGLGGSLPSGQMASFCGGVIMDEEMNSMNKKDGNAPSHSNFKNDKGPDPNQQSNAQNIQQDEDIDYSKSKLDFPTMLHNIEASKCNAAMDAYNKMIQKDIAYVQSLLPSLPKPTTSINEDGEMVKLFDYNNDPHYIQFAMMHRDFQKRRTKVYGQAGDKLASSSQAFATTYNAVLQAFITALKSCNDEDCVQRLKCEYYPKLRGTIKSYVMEVGDIVSSSIHQMEDESWDYISNSSPMLQYIAEPHWNGYLNCVREADIRMGKLLLMMSYQKFMSLCEAFVKQADALGTEGQCWTAMNFMPADIATPKLRPLKTLAPPCKPDPVADAPLNAGPLFYENNCFHTRIGIDFGKIGKSLDKGPVKAEASLGAKAYMELVKSKYVEEETIRAGLELTAKIKVNVNTLQDGTLSIAKIKTTANAELEANATLNEFWQWNKQGQLIKKGTTLDADAHISGNAGINAAIASYKKANADFGKQDFNYGLEGHAEYSAVMGPDGNLGNYQFRDLTINKTGK